LLRHCPTQTGRRVQPGEDRSAGCDHALSASVALPGREHAGAGGDQGAEPGGGASAACEPSAWTTGASSPEVGSAGTLAFDQSCSASAGPLVERANLNAVWASICLLGSEPVCKRRVQRS